MEKWKSLLQKHCPGDELQVNHLIGVGSGSAIVEVLQRVGRNLTRERFGEEMTKLTNWRSPVHAGPITCTQRDHPCNPYPGRGKLDVSKEHDLSRQSRVSY